jgi:hypothetical protein
VLLVSWFFQEVYCFAFTEIQFKPPFPEQQFKVNQVRRKNSYASPLKMLWWMALSLENNLSLLFTMEF